MIVRRLAAAALIALAVSPARADDAATPPPAKPVAAKHKTKPKPSDPADFQNVRFSDPSAPPDGSARSGSLVAPSQSSGVAKTPAGGVSLGVKWHAESHVNDPYWQPWVPNGEGESVQAGVKLGF
jgi:hypothetical protein